MGQHPILLGEAARIIEVSQETARRYADEGLLRIVRTSRGVRVFDRDDVIRFARERAERRASRTGQPS
jgi:DNA-binding transcriptional MerR regulator